MLRPQTKNVPASTQNVATAGRIEQDLERAAECGRRRDMGRGVAFVAVGLEADVLRLVDQKEDDEDRDDKESDDRRRERDAPAVAVGEPRGQRQQEELAGGARGARESRPRGRGAR